MPQDTLSPYRQIAEAVEGIINAEWAPEGWTARHDNLHASNGIEGVRIGIALEDESAAAGRMVQLNTRVVVKFYLRWDPDVDPSKRVDPRKIADHGERFRRAVEAYNRSHGGTPGFWYFNLMGIGYPNDPTGNKSRFEATLVAYGNNSGLVETTG